jgi:hypothetical protein
MLHPQNRESHSAKYFTWVEKWIEKSVTGRHS